MASFPAVRAPSRDDRFHEEKVSDGLRHGQRDRDRILYSSAWRRLAEVTQVVAAGEGHVFHNRLTHSLEVGQIARRLAEKLAIEQHNVAEIVGGVDPDVVEAAALAHDLGHPPFGHVAEQELDKLVTAAGVMDGFEGNAQSSRIVTRLIFNSPNHHGLNFSRATLNALLKYPRFRATGGEGRLKWGAYHTEEAEFEWARELSSSNPQQKSAEAELMDWADDVAYAVHDATDFYRAGRIPLDRLCSQKDDSERKRFYNEVFKRHQEAQIPLPFPSEELEEAFEGMWRLYPIDSPYQGKRCHRSSVRSLIAGLTLRYMNAIRLNIPRDPRDRLVSIDVECKKELFMLKQLTWHYIILGPALAAQQHGQRRIIRELFEIFQKAAANQKEHTIFPYAIRDELEATNRDAELRTRILADFISGMSEQQAVNMHAELTGAP